MNDLFMATEKTTMMPSRTTSEQISRRRNRLNRVEAREVAALNGRPFEVGLGGRGVSRFWWRRIVVLCFVVSFMGRAEDGQAQG